MHRFLKDFLIMLSLLAAALVACKRGESMFKPPKVDHDQEFIRIANDGCHLNKLGRYKVAKELLLLLTQIARLKNPWF